MPASIGGLALARQTAVTRVTYGVPYPPSVSLPCLELLNSIGVCLGATDLLHKSPGPVRRPGALASSGSRAWLHLKRR